MCVCAPLSPQQILEEPSSTPLLTLFQEPGTQTEPHPSLALEPLRMLSVDSEAPCD